MGSPFVTSGYAVTLLLYVMGISGFCGIVASVLNTSMERASLRTDIPTMGPVPCYLLVAINKYSHLLGKAYRINIPTQIVL